MTDQRDLIEPRLTILSEEQKKIIHKHSLKILSETGIRVDSKDAIAIFKKSGGVKINDNRVYIQSELVEESIRSAPSTIKLFKKTGEEAFTVGQQGLE